MSNWSVGRSSSLTTNPKDKEETDSRGITNAPNVECRDSPDPPDAKMCGLLMESVPNSQSMTIFGNRPSPEENFLLPKTYADGKNSISLSLSPHCENRD